MIQIHQRVVTHTYYLYPWNTFCIHRLVGTKGIVYVVGNTFNPWLDIMVRQLLTHGKSWLFSLIYNKMQCEMPPCLMANYGVLLTQI